MRKIRILLFFLIFPYTSLFCAEINPALGKNSFVISGGLYGYFEKGLFPECWEIIGQITI